MWEEALEFIQKKFPDFEKELEFFRECYCYALSGVDIFLEDIDGLISIEVESEDPDKLDRLLEKFDVKELLKNSLAEYMRNH